MGKYDILNAPQPSALSIFDFIGGVFVAPVLQAGKLAVGFAEAQRQTLRPAARPPGLQPRRPAARPLAAPAPLALRFAR